MSCLLDPNRDGPPAGSFSFHNSKAFEAGIESNVSRERKRRHTLAMNSNKRRHPLIERIVVSILGAALTKAVLYVGALSERSKCPGGGKIPLVC